MFDVKYTNKDILVIGGGTSTLDVNWEALNCRYTWTCNDFYMEQRLLDVPIDLYMLGFTTDLTSEVLIEKLRRDKPFVFYEPIYYRGKEQTPEFKRFKESIGVPVYNMSIPFNDTHYSPGQKSGAAFRLIQLALMTNAKDIYFAGFDGFNRDFSNMHAFTKHVGLKDSDTRRDWDGSSLAYVNVFLEAYKYLAAMKDSHRLQNLGEGYDYNLGTRISKKFFPLREEVALKVGNERYK